MKTQLALMEAQELNREIESITPQSIVYEPIIADEFEARRNRERMLESAKRTQPARVARREPYQFD